MIYLILGLLLALVLAAFFFIFNPLGLGPEPNAVLPENFFTTPTQDLSMLDLLIDGKAAFSLMISDIDAAESSIYIQTFI